MLAIVDRSSHLLKKILSLPKSPPNMGYYLSQQNNQLSSETAEHHGLRHPASNKK